MPLVDWDDMSSALSSIVLLAHGPTSETLTAARRLETLVADTHDIIVVAATPPGLTAVDRAADRGYATSTACASDLQSILEASRGLDALTDAIMVVHDDVLIDAASVVTLREAHTHSGLVAIPPHASNEGEPVDVVCAVGTAAQLIELAASAAFAPGMTVVGEFAQPANAKSTHHPRCQQRTISPKDLDRPLLVAGLIVRDEQDNIADCLASLNGIVDRIEICDTGSLDRTIELAEAAGAHITTAEWCDDFARARNQVLAQCTDAAYMLWIDADERFVCDDPVSFREMLATYHQLYPSFSVNLHNVRADGTQTHSFMTRRIADPTLIYFEGAIHERAERLDGQALVTAFITNAAIDHLGYDEDVVDLVNKQQRNLATARQGFEAAPSDTNAVQLARALRGASTNPNATLDELDDIYRTISAPTETVRAVIYGLRAELLLEADRLEESVAAATATLDLVPADSLAGAVLAEALLQSNRLDDIVTTANDYDARPSVRPLVQDHLAKQTRARIIFEAAVRLGDITSAQAHASDLPAELDPWPILARHLSTTGLIEMAEQAGASNDVRFVHAAISRADLSRANLEQLEAAFVQTDDPAVSLLLAETRDGLDTADTHVDLRIQFFDTGREELAIAYARSLCVGQVDLDLELDDVALLHDPTAAALSIAASAHLRRGDDAPALADATQSLTRWAGCTRAALIQAQQCLDQHQAAEALRIIDSARRAEHHDRVTSDRRTELARLAIRSQLQLDNIEAAASEATEIIDSGGDLGLWPEFLNYSNGDLDASTFILSLALIGDGVEFIDSLATSVAPMRTAQLCAAYLALGGTNPDAVSTGTLAAVLAGANELALVIVEHGSLLPDEIRTRLAQHLSENSARHIAERLEGYVASPR